MNAPSEKHPTVQDMDQAETAAYEAVRHSILDVAPDLSEGDLQSSTELQDDLGLDSIDLVNVAKAIEERTGVAIPSDRYARLRRIGQIVDFLVENRTGKP